MKTKESQSGLFSAHKSFAPSSLCAFALIFFFSFIFIFSFSKKTFSSEDTDWTAYARDNGLYETSLARLGSRFVINPRPRDGEWLMSPFGVSSGKPGRMILAIESGGQTRFLPFSGNKPLCARTTQKQTMTSLSYTCTDPALPVETTFTFTSPFSPGDEKISGAPFFNLKISLRARQGATGRVTVSYDSDDFTTIGQYGEGGVVGIEGGNDGIDNIIRGEFVPRGSVVMAASSGDSKQISWKYPFSLPDGKIGHGIGFEWNFALDADAGNQPGELESPLIVIAAYASEPAPGFRKDAIQLRYSEQFKNTGDVARWALENQTDIEKKSNEFDENMNVLHSAPKIDSLPALSALAFNSWLMNTSWTERKNGDQRFDVYDGPRMRSSSIDMIYGQGPLYLELWPELLKMQLDQWAVANVDESGALKNKSVEESADFILLLGAYWKKTGDNDTLLRHGPLVIKLVDYLIKADTSGNGFADEGTGNSINNGIAATHYAPEQTYLAVKTLAAFKFVTLMAAPLNAPALVPLCEDFMAKIRATLKKPAWMGGHFSVTLRHTVDFLDPRGNVERTNPGNHIYVGEDDEHNLIADIGGHLNGWNAHSIYSANGFYYLLRAGIPLPLDSELLDMFHRDIERTAEVTLQQYGSTHTEADTAMLVSQNIWQDMLGAYFGIDTRPRMERYWDFEKEMNQRPHDGGDTGCFTEAYNYGSFRSGLGYNPRGAAIFGLPAAWSAFNTATADVK